MSSRSDFRRTSWFVLPLCGLMSGCGGSSGSSFIANIPPPPATPAPTTTPTPTSPAPTPIPAPTAGAVPATSLGTHDLLGILRWDTTAPAAPGAFTMTITRPSSGDTYAYKMTAPLGFLPGTLTSIDYGPSADWLRDANGHIRVGLGKVLPYQTDQNINSGLALDAGYSYVSMGEWQWYLVHLDGGTAAPGGDLFFVTGDRTPESGIPASGTATYDARTFALLSRDLTSGIPFTLTADFGGRTISTRIDQDYRYNPNGDLLDEPAPGIHVGGSAPFSNSGSFALPLTGTASYGYNQPEAPAGSPVTGSMAGAFFGPHAEQVGGVLMLQSSGGVQVLRDAFVGQQHH